MTLFTTRSVLAPTLALAFLAACGEEIEPNDLTDDTQDTVTDTEDTQDTEDTDDTQDTDRPSTARSSLQGQVHGDASSATTVESHRVNEDGTTTQQGSGSVDANGSFTVDIEVMGNGGAMDDTNDFALIQAFDASGELVGELIVEETGAEDETVEAGLIDAESTVEARSWLALVARRGSTANTNFAQVRQRVRAHLAATIYGSGTVDSMNDGRDDFAGLVAGLNAALETELEAMADDGYNWSAEDVYALQKDASLDLTADLMAMVDSSSSSSWEMDRDMVEADFLANLTAALEANLSGDATSRAEDSSRYHAVGGLSLMSVLQTYTSKSSDTYEGAFTGYSEVQAWLSARATSMAYDDTDWSGNSLSTDIQAALDVLVDTTWEAENAGDAETSLMARLDLQTELMGEFADEDTDAEDWGLIETLLTLDLKAALQVDGVISDVEEAGASLVVDIEAAAEAQYDDTSDDVDDAHAMAMATLDGWAEESSTMIDLGASLATTLGVDGSSDNADFFGTLFVQTYAAVGASYED